MPTHITAQTASSLHTAAQAISTQNPKYIRPSNNADHGKCQGSPATFAPVKLASLNDFNQ
jgi:hypothetical protein